MTNTRLMALARGERGASMIFTLLSLAMVTTLGLGLTSVAMSTVAMAVAESETTEALAIADAGVEHGKQLVLWQDWQSLNVFLQRGDAAGCTYDELSGTPINIPLPAGYPTTAPNFIPATGRAFGQGRYFVQLCDNHAAELVAAGAQQQQRPEQRRRQARAAAQRRLRTAWLTRGRRAVARCRGHAGRRGRRQPRGKW